VLRDVFNLPDHSVYDWYWLLLTGSVFILPTTRVDAVVDDPDDNKFIACAIDGGAQFVVTEDKDLVRIGVYQFVQIIRKQAFLALLESQTDR
jgi:predicted nucleic acid-binding protein